MASKNYFKILIPIILITTISGSQIDEIKKTMMANYLENSINTQNIKNENEKLINENSVFYVNIVKKSREYYQGYIGKHWGSDNVKLSSNKNFTQYSGDMNSREDIDFKNGIVTLEMITDMDKEISAQSFEQRLKKLKNSTISEAIENDPISKLSKEYLKNKKISDIEQDIENNDKFLTNLIDETSIKKEDIKERIIELEDGTKKKIIYVNVKMVPEHLKKRAQHYRAEVIVQAKRFNVRPSYILGTMQTESYFNPLALSHVPAYGLMQIVPSTAGKDAYFELEGKKRLLPPTYLYNANNNIELGVQYIQIIKEKYLRGIKNKKSLLYCTATAYNAGIGSLVKSFTGGYYKRKEAIAIINTMTPAEVYKHLRTSNKLTLEAKGYVKKIKINSQNYYKWDI